MSEDATPSPKKSASSLQSAVLTAAAASKLWKRQASEPGTSSSQGWSASRPIETSNPPGQGKRRMASSSAIHQGEASGGDGVISYDFTNRRPAYPLRASDPPDAATRSIVTDDSQPLVLSPESMSSSPPALPRPLRDQPRTASPSRPTTPVTSAPRAHWNKLRNAVLPNSVPSVANFSNFSQTNMPVPPRPQTPKPSRLARLGFRHVVDQTREDFLIGTSRFDMEIYQACMSARFGDIKLKTERDASQSYLPFMSNSSIPFPGSSNNGQAGRSGPTQSNEILGRSPPSLKLLHQTLIRYSATVGSDSPAVSLPRELEILSVLLIPFTMEFIQRGDDERWLAVESFELAAKTWRAASPERGLDRALWCLKAALIPASPVRSRVLATLSNIVFSSTPLQIRNPLALQNFLQGLLFLLYSFSKDFKSSRKDVEVVKELIAHITGGGCGQLDQQEVETEYEGLWGLKDDETTVRNQIVLEGVVQCIQNGPESFRRWILHESVKMYWHTPSQSLSPLCRKIMARRLNSFLHASISLLRSYSMQPPHSSLELDALAICSLLHHALPELGQLPLPKQYNDGRALGVALVIELVSISSPAHKQGIIEIICRWAESSDDWKQCLETGLGFYTERTEWPRLTRVLHDVIRDVPEDVRKIFVAVILPALNTRLVIEPALNVSPGLTSLLQTLAQLYPQQFYKPIFSLAAASKESTVFGQLATVSSLARHLPDFWLLDSEMISVALMSDIGGVTEKTKTNVWGKARIGQSLIMVELLRSVRQLNNEKRDKSLPPDVSKSQAYRFATGLEARLAILVDAKEKTILIPFSQRILLSHLFLEIRLFTRSLKPAPWLPRIAKWAAQSYTGANLIPDDDLFQPQNDPDIQAYVGDDVLDEASSTFHNIGSIHAACWQASTSTRHLRSMSVSTNDPRVSTAANADSPNANAEAIKERQELMASLSTSVASATLRSLVAMCALVGEKEYRTISIALWSRFLDDKDSEIVAPASFLLTHCLEHFPAGVIEFIERDKQSSDGNIRGSLIQRLMTLFSWRSQLLSQTFIYDRAHRRPFKLARQPTSFVAIDAGSAHYIHEETEEDQKNITGGTLNLELRRRLAELGWKQDDQPTDVRLERVKAPISLFSLSQLEHFSPSPESGALNPAKNMETPLRHKSSSSAQHGIKRRPVFVPALVSMFTSIATLTFDPDPIVANAACEAVLVMLRDDPVMLCQPVLEMLSTGSARVGVAVSILNMFLHIHHRLPPSASHHLFSYLGGFLKHMSRDSKDPDALRAFSYIVPLLAKLIAQVSNLSLRDLRRAKFEMYLFPSGSLWFPPTAPSSAMFPQSQGPNINPFDELPSQLVGILTVRAAQNILTLNMLKQKPQEAPAIRKGLMRLTLPGQDSDTDLDINSFLPRQLINENTLQIGFRKASLAFSRSHLLLLGQIFRTMPRNFNTSTELARHFDGLNRILLEHGNDIGIVSHALIVCMIAVTRFKRLMSSSGGFALFMPGVLKAYAEAGVHVGIRQAIQFASSRFYAIHQESYTFQSLELASIILARLELSERDWFAKNVFELFSALKSPIRHSMPDAAAIRGSNLAEERDALIDSTISDNNIGVSSQDTPRGERLKQILATEQYENKLLNLDNLVRLLLTVIAHDPTIIRGQNFLLLLRHMAAEFYNGSNSARRVLQDGIDALGSALFNKGPRPKMTETVQGRRLHKANVDASSRRWDNGKDGSFDPTAPSNQVLIRREYIELILVYLRMGGDLSRETIQHALDIVKGLLKDSTREPSESEGTFIHKLTQASLTRLSVTPKQAITLLSDVGPIVKAYGVSIDFSGFLETVMRLVNRPEMASDNSLMQLVVDQIAGPALDACADAALDNTLMSLPMRSAVVSLVAQIAAGGTDIVSHIENQPPLPGFLAGIVLPLCLTMKTSADFVADQRWQRHHPSSKGGDFVFLRLLVYAMGACRVDILGETEKLSSSHELSRKDSRGSKRSSLSASRAPLATLALSIQIIKVIIVRAGDDLSRGLVGIWDRLAKFLRDQLDDGNARFALTDVPSPVPSPSQSPILRPHSPSSDIRVSSMGRRLPRVVDYLTWSMLEYLCCAPSPLTLQMRLWMQEKLHDLDAELRFRESPNQLSGSVPRPFSGSVFARPRGASTSPEALRARGLSTAPSELSLTALTPTDFSRPSSRGSLHPPWSGPRILHLEPSKSHEDNLQTMERSSSRRSNLKKLARDTHVTSASLLKSTERRIRLVQVYLGYDRLLKPYDEDEEYPYIKLKPWTKSSTLTAIVAEMEELMDEFPENFYDDQMGDFVDVPPASAFNSARNSPDKDFHSHI